jgi:hypothetical protein
MNPVSKYLEGRGITVSLPPDIRYERPQNGNYGAMVLAATDNSGITKAIQRVLIHEGRKAPIKPDKLTNGVMENAAVRLPALQGNELVLAEGPETALSVWQAWGRETWVALGSVSKIVDAIPKDRSVVIARDYDEPGSQADKALWKAVEKLIQRGGSLRVVSPPNPTHYGYDFNDALVEYGNEVVAEQLENDGVINPRYPAQSGTVSEAREAVHSAFTAWTEALPIYWQKMNVYRSYQAEVEGNDA